LIAALQVKGDSVEEGTEIHDLLLATPVLNSDVVAGAELGSKQGSRIGGKKNHTSEREKNIRTSSAWARWKT